MKVLIVNKFYYPRGGDCIVAMSTARLLREAGHEVRVFAMDYPENLKITDAGGYASNVDFSGPLMSRLKAAGRVLGFAGVRHSFRKVLDEFRPDVVHLHNIHSYLSPAVAQEASRRGIRTVWTLHDYKLICPAYSCRRTDGSVCEECIGGRLKVAGNRCMKGSLIQSAMADIEARRWNRQVLQKATDLFIAPSQFMANKMMQAGFAASRLVNICNFVDPAKMEALSAVDAGKGRREGFCYIGRISEEKGVETLARAAADAGVQLNLAGGGPLLESLRERYSAFPNIHFLGHLDAEGVVALLARSEASVLASEWYENNPLGVIESLCAGTPVIGADIGGIPELITPESGIVFSSGSADELTAVFRSFSKRRPFDHKAIAADARSRFSADAHLEKLLKAYGME